METGGGLPYFHPSLTCQMGKWVESTGNSTCPENTGLQVASWDILFLLFFDLFQTTVISQSSLVWVFSGSRGAPRRFYVFDRPNEQTVGTGEDCNSDQSSFCIHSLNTTENKLLPLLPWCTEPWLTRGNWFRFTIVFCNVAILFYNLPVIYLFMCLKALSWGTSNILHVLYWCPFKRGTGQKAMDLKIN